jgi:hypothetical protein
MRFVFEEDESNFIKCEDVNTSGIKRFPPSPLVSRLPWHYKSKLRFWPRKYIIASGVAHHPNNWAGLDKESFFSLLNYRYLTDLKHSRAMLLLDQSHEGYQTQWLWEYFHKQCRDYQINPQLIIYVTGNLLAEEQYLSWADANNIIDRINVISYAHFEVDIDQLATKLGLPTEFSLDYKTNHLESIKLFNCLNKRNRPHRFWFYTRLIEHNLVDQGLISINKFDTRHMYVEGQLPAADLIEQANRRLPSTIYGTSNTEQPDSYYINRIRDDVCADSWVSVVSESSFSDMDNEIFVSEKTFKPIACMHPFIILGNQGSLAKLREMGYKTFDGWIDETYDQLPTFERMEAIVSALKKISEIEDKLVWYKSMQHILEHNRKQLSINARLDNSAIVKLRSIG